MKLKAFMLASLFAHCVTIIILIVMYNHMVYAHKQIEVSTMVSTNNISARLDSIAVQVKNPPWWR